MVLYSKIKKLFKKDDEDKSKEESVKKEESIKPEAVYKDTSKKKSDDEQDLSVPAPSKEKPKAVKKEKLSSLSHKILIRPVISEKASILAEDGKYCFVIHPKANKSEVKKAVYSVYGVKPIKVNIININGKFVRFGRRFGKRKDWKKAIVVLPKGKKLEVYEGV